MRIAARLNGWLVAPFYLMVGVIFGMIVLRAGVLVSLALSAGFLLVVLVWFYSIIGILAVIGGACFIPFNSALPLANVGSIHIPDLILYLLIGLVILKTLVLTNIRMVRTPLDIPLIIFVVVGIASLVVGKFLNLYDFFQALREFKVVLYYLLALIITNIIRDKRELKLLIYGCLSLGIIAAFTIILQAWINPPGASDDPMEVFYRYQEGMSGGLLSYWTLIALICFLFVSKVRFYYILGAVIPLFSLILSFSRHWWISFVFSVSLIFAFNFKKNRARIFGILSLIIFFAFLVVGAFLLRIEPIPTYLNLITTRAETLTFREKVDNWEIRKVENKYAIEKILSQPIWGIGFQRPYRPQIYFPEDNIDCFVHNGYLWILLKLGIIGFVPFVWFSLIFVLRGMRYWNHVEDKFLKGIVLGSVCAYLGIALASVAAPHFMQNWEVAVLGLLFGVNEVIYRMQGLDSKNTELK